MKVKKLILGDIKNNTYILSEKNECIVIDPSSEYDKIKKYIDENDLAVKAILITHGHYDHIYSVYKLKKDTNAPIYMHKDDVELYSAMLDRINSPFVDIDIFLQGSETLDLIGKKFKVMHTPGHSFGCVIYIVEDMMFTGDTLFKNSIGRTDLMTSNPSQMQETLKQLVQIDTNYKVYCGHGDDTTFFEELENNPYLRSGK